MYRKVFAGTTLRFKPAGKLGAAQEKQVNSRAGRRAPGLTESGDRGFLFVLL